MKASSTTLMVSLMVNTACTSSSRNNNAIDSHLYLNVISFLASYDAIKIDGGFLYSISPWQFYSSGLLLRESIFHPRDRLGHQSLRGGANRLFQSRQQV